MSIKSVRSSRGARWVRAAVKYERLRYVANTLRLRDGRLIFSRTSLLDIMKGAQP